MTDLQTRIESLWEQRDTLDTDDPEVVATVHEAIDLLDTGAARVAEIGDDGDVVVHQWLKLAILLLFKIAKMDTIEVGPFEFADKIPLKTDYAAHGVRVVPGASARWGSHQAPGVVMMPSYVNIGAYVGENSMVDTWATVGSCAQIGARRAPVRWGRHRRRPRAPDGLAGHHRGRSLHRQPLHGHQRRSRRPGRSARLGGHPQRLHPGHRCRDRRRAVSWRRPAWCVTVLATRPREFAGGTFGLPCALVIKRLDEGERHDKAALNDVLRTHGVAL